MAMDGYLPLARWFGDDFSPRLSDRDGQIHTVCRGFSTTTKATVR
jgi:hypothetical protein